MICRSLYKLIFVLRPAMSQGSLARALQVFAFLFLLGGCNWQSSTLAEPQMSVAVPSLLQSVRAVDPDALVPLISINGEEQAVTREGNTWLVQATVFSNTAVISVEWIEVVRGQNLTLANWTSTQSSLSQNQTITVSSEDYQYLSFDDDGDGISNLDERRTDTDPFVANTVASGDVDVPDSTDSGSSPDITVEQPPGNSQTEPEPSVAIPLDIDNDGVTNDSDPDDFDACLPSISNYACRSQGTVIDVQPRIAVVGSNLSFTVFGFSLADDTEISIQDGGSCFRVGDPGGEMLTFSCGAINTQNSNVSLVVSWLGGEQLITYDIQVEQPAPLETEVLSVRTSNAVVGQTAIFDISGTNIPGALEIFLDGADDLCDVISRSTNTASGTDELQVACRPLSPGLKELHIVEFAGAELSGSPFVISVDPPPILANSVWQARESLFTPDNVSVLFDYKLQFSGFTVTYFETFQIDSMCGTIVADQRFEAWYSLNDTLLTITFSDDVPAGIDECFTSNDNRQSVNTSSRFQGNSQTFILQTEVGETLFADRCAFFYNGSCIYGFQEYIRVD